MTTNIQVQSLDTTEQGKAFFLFVTASPPGVSETRCAVTLSGIHLK